MVYVTRKCVCCRNLLQVYYDNGDLNTCISCLEKANVKYREDKETILRRCKLYRNNTAEKEK